MNAVYITLVVASLVIALLASLAAVPLVIIARQMARQSKEAFNTPLNRVGGAVGSLTFGRLVTVFVACFVVVVVSAAAIWFAYGMGTTLFDYQARCYS